MQRWVKRWRSDSAKLPVARQPVTGAPIRSSGSAFAWATEIIIALSSICGLPALTASFLHNPVAWVLLAARGEFSDCSRGPARPCRFLIFAVLVCHVESYWGGVSSMPGSRRTCAQVPFSTHFSGVGCAEVAVKLLCAAMHSVFGHSVAWHCCAATEKTTSLRRILIPHREAFFFTGLHWPSVLVRTHVVSWSFPQLRRRLARVCFSESPFQCSPDGRSTVGPGAGTGGRSVGQSLFS